MQVLQKKVRPYVQMASLSQAVVRHVTRSQQGDASAISDPGAFWAFLAPDRQSRLDLRKPPKSIRVHTGPTQPFFHEGTEEIISDDACEAHPRAQPREVECADGTGAAQNDVHVSGQLFLLEFQARDAVDEQVGISLARHQTV